MIDPETRQRFSPGAYRWAQEQENLVLKLGAPLNARQLEDARLAGVEHPERVRILVVDRIPFPDDPDLAEAGRHTQIITTATPGICVGYGIMIRGDRWQNRELLVHLLVHVGQCERCGGLETYIGAYIEDRAGCADFGVGPLEGQARRVAREVCNAEAATR
ncbi:MAG: hypothetical protein M3Y03_05310 [Verrucomicrobiota bacterium]|nr:hypothetical protein [Verrucomicrobiota bacterium]